MKSTLMSLVIRFLDLPTRLDGWTLKTETNMIPAFAEYDRKLYRRNHCGTWWQPIRILGCLACTDNEAHADCLPA